MYESMYLCADIFIDMCASMCGDMCAATYSDTVDCAWNCIGQHHRCSVCKALSMLDEQRCLVKTVKNDDWDELLARMVCRL